MRGDGPDNTFNTADDVVYPLTINNGAPYQVGTNDLTFTRTGGLSLPADRYRFTGFSAAAQLRDPFGTALDGDADGTAGGNFVSEFGSNPQITGAVFEDWNGTGTRDGNDLGVAGRVVYLDLNGNGALDSTSASFANTTKLPIPDNNTPVTSTIAVSGTLGSVTDVNVRVNITHPYDADLDVYLIGPDGTRVELFTDVGGSGDNFADTVLDDEAAVAITAGSAPFTGSYRPEGSLAALDGRSANGTWPLELTDDAAGDVGTLNNWELTIATSEPFAVSAANGNGFLDLHDGAGDIRLTPLGGWKFTAPSDGKHVVTAGGAPLYDRRFGVAEAVPPTVTGVAINPSGVQRSRVNSLTVTFSERVILPATPASAFTLTRTGVGPVALNAAVDNTGPATVVTLTFADNATSGSLNDGEYTLTVLAAEVRDVAQNPMTANPTQPFHRLFGDANGDRFVDATDEAQFGSTFGLQVGSAGYLTDLDYNADGFVDATDEAQFGSRFGTNL